MAAAHPLDFYRAHLKPPVILPVAGFYSLILKVAAFELNNNYLGWQAIKFLIKYFRRGG
jgi:hypothetical protein